MFVPDWIVEACEKSRAVTTPTRCGLIHYNEDSNPCSGEIASILIQNVGRFVESYASDFLIYWKQVEKLTSLETVRKILSQPTEPDPAVIVFALKRAGVDSNTDFANQMRITAQSRGYYANGREIAPITPDNYYRKVFAIRVKINKEENVMEAELRDMTDTLFRVPFKD